jgi:hypothetical protein
MSRLILRVPDALQPHVRLEVDGAARAHETEVEPGWRALRIAVGVRTPGFVAGGELECRVFVPEGARVEVGWLA